MLHVYRLLNVQPICWFGVVRNYRDPFWNGQTLRILPGLTKDWSTGHHLAPHLNLVESFELSRLFVASTVLICMWFLSNLDCCIKFGYVPPVHGIDF